MTDLREYERQVAQGAVLGVITFYTVQDTLLAHEDLVQILADNNLSAFTPTRPADADVFRRVCTQAQRKRQATSDADVYENILVRDVAGGDSAELVKRVVSERVNGKGRRLDYTEMYDVRFYRKGSNVKVTRVASTLQSTAADEVAQEIVAGVPAQLGHVNGNAIRDLINKALVGSSAISVREGGGVYFVPRRNTRVVDSLEALAAIVPGTTVHAIPLPDVPKQRDFLTQSVEFESEAEIERTMTEIRNLLTGNEKVSVDRVTGFMTRFRKLKGRAAEYAELLETNLGNTQSALEVLSKQLAVLAQKAE